MCSLHNTAEILIRLALSTIQSTNQVVDRICTLDGSCQIIIQKEYWTIVGYVFGEYNGPCTLNNIGTL